MAFEGGEDLAPAAVARVGINPGQFVVRPLAAIRRLLFPVTQPEPPQRPRPQQPRARTPPEPVRERDADVAFPPDVARGKYAKRFGAGPQHARDRRERARQSFDMREDLGIDDKVEL